MKNIDVKIQASPTQNYPILIGKNILGQGADFVLKNFAKHRIACLIDINVCNIFKNKVDEFCEMIAGEKFIFPSGEKNKNLVVIEKLATELLAKNFGRETLICNIGGGVVGDAGGFLAANFMRGVPFVQIPTTLLSMVDASVGGKVAVDLGNFKNSFGSFSSPSAIFADIDFLERLPKSEFISGMGECLKHGILGDFKILEEKVNRSDLENFVIRNIQLKKNIVEKDFRESGIRALLNLGHTVGHAIESFFLDTKDRVSHGEAVALGVLAEAKILESKGILVSGGTKKIHEIFETHNLPVALSAEIEAEKLWKFAQKDKKNEDGKVFISRIENIGDNLENNAPFKIAITKAEFLQGLNSILKT